MRAIRGHRRNMMANLRWYYLSFADDGKGWLGATCVEACSIKDAIRVSHERGINPGGEVLTIPLTPHEPPEEAKYKFMKTEEEVCRIFKTPSRKVEVDEVSNWIGPVNPLRN
jgi:hypothetical protein